MGEILESTTGWPYSPLSCALSQMTLTVRTYTLKRSIDTNYKLACGDSGSKAGDETSRQSC